MRKLHALIVDSWPWNRIRTLETTIRLLRLWLYDETTKTDTLARKLARYEANECAVCRWNRTR